MNFFLSYNHVKCFITFTAIYEGFFRILSRGGGYEQKVDQIHLKYSSTAFAEDLLPSITANGWRKLSVWQFKQYCVGWKFTGVIPRLAAVTSCSSRWDHIVAKSGSYSWSRDTWVAACFSPAQTENWRLVGQYRSSSTNNKVGISLSKSTIERSLHERKYRLTDWILRFIGR